VRAGAVGDAACTQRRRPAAGHRLPPPQRVDRPARQNFLPQLAKTGGDDAWRLLVGDAAASKQLADSVGFNFYWSNATNQYAHPPSLIFLTREGKVSRTIVNTVFDPADLRLALVEASEGKLGTFWDQVRLNCLTFDSRTNSYSLTAMTIMRIGGAITLVALATMIVVMLRRERRPTPAVA
jgi:protein SCO1/2